MGPRLRLITFLQKEFPDKTVKDKGSHPESHPGTTTSRTAEIYKEQKTTNVSADGGWNLKKMEAKVINNFSHLVLSVLKTLEHYLTNVFTQKC